MSQKKRVFIPFSNKQRPHERNHLEESSNIVPFHHVSPSSTELSPLLRDHSRHEEESGVTLWDCLQCFPASWCPSSWGSDLLLVLVLLVPMDPSWSESGRWLETVVLHHYSSFSDLVMEPDETQGHMICTSISIIPAIPVHPLYSFIPIPAFRATTCWSQWIKRWKWSFNPVLNLFCSRSSGEGTLGKLSHKVSQ